MSINLVKGQNVPLKSPSGAQLTKCFMGLGWDEVQSGKSIDLDASCVMFSDSGQIVDTIWFRDMKSSNGAVYLTEDNRTGKGQGDDEQIYVNLANIPANVKTLVFSVTSYEGQTFSEIKNCFARFVDTGSNEELCKYNFDEKPTDGSKPTNTALVLCKLYRHTDGWKFKAIGSTCNGRTVKDITRDVSACL
jgi:tellurium resistance protein TerZ